MSELDDRIRRGERMVEILRSYPHSTVRQEAAKQLETIVRGVKQHRATGTSDEALCKRLEWTL